jgi:hypothetical protein
MIKPGIELRKRKIAAIKKQSEETKKNIKNSAASNICYSIQYKKTDRGKCWVFNDAFFALIPPIQ